jgi:hypothetical protein
MITTRVPGIHADTLLGTTPQRPGELKTAEDFARERRDDRIGYTDLIGDLHVADLAA